MSSQDTGVTDPSKNEKSIHNAGLQIDEQDVADYLRRNPGFFEDKPSLLADLRVPHQTGSAVSLVERQVASLRESNESRQAQLDGLIQIARDNDNLNSHLHRLTLRLMEVDKLDILLAVIINRLKKDFGADLATIQLLLPPISAEYANLPEFITDTDTFNGSFQNVFTRSKPYCGRLKSEQLKILFSDQAENIGSTALLPLGKKPAVGLMAIGSFDRNRFTAGTDTDFLARMAEIINAALGKHLKK